MKDLFNEVHPVCAIAPVSVADNTAQVGQVIDRKGFESVTYLIQTGNLADADAAFLVLLEEGNQPDLSDAAAVDDTHLIGTETLAGFNYGHDNQTRKLGYIGAKRYTRLTITPTGNASAALLAAVAVLGHAAIGPTPNPPV